MNRKKTSGRKQKMFRAKRDSMQEIAKERISVLFNEAEKNYSSNASLSDRYVFLAGKISAKFKVPFTREQKLKYCKGCGKYIVPGNNASVRLSKGNIVVKCQNCGTIKRLKYGR